MKIPPPSLFIFPALALGLFFFSLLNASLSRKTLDQQNRIDGVVEAMLLTRSSEHEVVSGITSDVVFELASGEKRTLRLERGQLVSPSAAELGRHAQHVPILATGGGKDIVWLMRRESRSGNADRIVRMEVIQTAVVAGPLNELPREFTAQEGAVLPIGGGEARVAVTRAVYGFEASKKSPQLLEFSATLDGHPIETKLKDFILHREQWLTEFRPVITLQTDGDKQFVISDLGRQLLPANGFTISSPARLYPSNSPGEFLASAVVTDSVDGDATWLRKFSRQCETFFSRWAHTFMLLMISFGLSLVGGILIFLWLKPPKLDQDC